MSQTVAIFGGSFNPPHVGHLIVAVYLRAVAQVDQVLVVPCFIHPFAKHLASFEDRLDMCRAAFAWIPGVTVSDVERELGGESRTLRTVQTLAARHPDWALRLVVGSDIIPETPRWYGFDEIRAVAPLLVLDRPQPDRPGPSGALFPNVSSSAVREACARGDFDAVRDLLPARVLEHIRARGLFARSNDT